MDTKVTQLPGPLPTGKSLACNIFLSTWLMVTDYMNGEENISKNLKCQAQHQTERHKTLGKCCFKPYQMFHTNYFQTSHCLNKSSDHTENPDLPKNFI